MHEKKIKNSALPQNYTKKALAFYRASRGLIMRLFSTAVCIITMIRKQSSLSLVQYKMSLK